jgi:hypothetical protein
MYQPYPGSGQPPEPVRREPPASVVMAVRFMYGGAALSAISLVILLVTIGSLRTAIQNAFPHYTASQVHNAEVATIAVAVVLQLVGIGLWIWMAMANRAGKNWARMVATVLFAVNTLFLFLGFARPGALGSRVLGILIWLAGLGAIVLLWRKESSDYFQSATRP